MTVRWKPRDWMRCCLAQARRHPYIATTSTTPTGQSRCSCSGRRCSRIPGSALLYRPGRKPLLLVLEPADYWHQAAPVPDGPWQRALDIRVIRQPAELRRHLPRAAKALALLGDPAQWRGLEIERTHSTPDHC
jgi:hypothetical protein